jgi:prevent-host-death family protein
MLVQFYGMEIAVADAKPIFSELLRRANAGEEVVVTRHGRPYALITPLDRRRGLPRGERLAAILATMERARERGLDKLGIDAATSQDFLYDPDTGMPA